MKLLAAILLIASFQLSRAQDEFSAEKAKAAQAARQEQRKLEERERAARLMERPFITYSGFLVDLGRAEKKSKLLSLRQPADPKRDARNLYDDPRTGRPKGFVLFQLSF